MRGKWTRSVLIWILALVFIFAGNVPEAAALVDLSEMNGLEIIPGTYEDLENAEIEVDLYRVADAVADPEHGDTYVFKAVSGIELSKGIDSYEHLTALDHGDWRQLAQEAAKAVLTGTEPVLSAEKDHQALSSGLYLIVAHGTGMSMEEYLTTNEEGQLCTIANTDEYVYTWLPELIALPSPVSELGPGGDGTASEVNSAQGEWQHQVSAVLKPGQEPRYGDLEIRKTLSLYEDSSPVTFVFHISATLRDKVVYDDIAALTFSGPGTRTARIEGKIPVGAQVTVTEIYSGAGYTATGSLAAETVIVAQKDENGQEQDPASVSFENRYDNKVPHGYGILNQFVYSETDGWQLDNTHDSSGK